MKKGLIIGLSSVVGIGVIIGVLFLIHGKIEVSLVDGDEVNTTYKEEYQEKGVVVKKNDEELPEDKYSVDATNNIDIEKLGDYRVDYKVKYLWSTYKLSRTVHVVDDVKPEIKVSVDKIDKDFCSKKVQTKYTYTSMDNYDGDITDKVTIEETDENVIFKSVDSNGNEGETLIPINYTKKPNPVFRVKGSSTTYVTLNSKYKDEGILNQDGCGNNLKEEVVTSGSVDTSKTGTYKITYKVGDRTLTRNVVVYKPNISNNTSNKNKVIYLTFDDGPGQYTQKVLNTLNKYGVKATFFVTHQFSSYVPLIKKEHEAGHSVAVHSYTHEWNVYKSVDAYVKDFNKMNADIEKYTGSKSKLFRFPGGSSNTISRKYAKGVVKAIASKMTSDGYVYFDWDVDSGDAAGASRSKIYSNVVNGVARCKQCVVLMHDIKPNTVNELDNILKTLTSKGYKFGTLNTSSPTAHQKIVN